MSLMDEGTLEATNPLATYSERIDAVLYTWAVWENGVTFVDSLDGYN